jgi:hypothetical protein
MRYSLENGIVEREARNEEKIMNMVKSIKFLSVFVLLLLGLPAGKADKDTK